MSSSDLEIRAAAAAARDATLAENSAAVLTRDATAFVVALEREFRARLADLLAARAAFQRRLDVEHAAALGFLDETRHVRDDATWRCAPLPHDLLDRRVEITGPVERKMVINALNSGACAFMADFEDATSPTWEQVINGQANLRDAVRRVISYYAPETKREYILNEKTAVLIVRPRGLHLPEKHMLLDGKPLSGSLVDFGLYFFHNAKELIAQGTGPYFYIPKLESYLEARLWNDVFAFSEKYIGLPHGTIRATMLIETLPAAFQMDEILYELRDYAAGLNCGRWDYIFSFIKKLRSDPTKVLPDRGQVGMDRAFLHAYSLLSIKTCHKRGCSGLGGMAPQIPVRNDEAANKAAMASVHADKLREVTDGHDGTWVAHPGLVEIAKRVFDEHMKTPNQIDRKRDDVHVTVEDLLEVHSGTRTEEGLRLNMRVYVHYVEAWLRGQGCVAIYSRMEDAATAEISRTSIWQWLHYGVTLDEPAGVKVTRELFDRLLDEEMRRVESEVGSERFRAGKYAQARDLFVRLSTQAEVEEFLTLSAYDMVVAAEGVL